MALLQTYETWIADSTSQMAVVCLVVPQRSMPAREPSVDVEAVLSELDFEAVRDVRASHLPYALAAMLAAAKGGGDALEIYGRLLTAIADDQVEDIVGRETLSFAEQVCFQNVIPFESSPLEPVSLVSLLTKTGGMGLGAYAGWVIAGSTPLLLLWIPAGMILCGAAAGIAAGFEEGLRSRIARWLKGEPVTPKGRKSRTEEELGPDADKALSDIVKGFEKEITKAAEQSREGKPKTRQAPPNPPKVRQRHG